VTGVVLGLDGGGTKVLAHAADADGAVRGTGTAGACNIASLPLEEALANALAASHAALGEAGAATAQVRALCAGVAGTSFGQRRVEFRAALARHFPGARIAVEPDYAIALTGATGGAPGLIVIAGTGSVAYGEDAAGRSHKTGAYGYLIDDGGSGYGVGRAALAAALRAADGTGEATSLAERLCAALRLASLADIVPGVYGGTIDRVVIASLSRVVADAAREDNDAVARALLLRAGGTLARLARGVTARLFSDAPEPFPVVPVGGLWEAGAPLTDAFERSLRRKTPQARLTPPLQTPVQGAVRRALALLA
jgi:N-acetylglucosamine kinase-like BadF-type ATPase